MTRWEAQQKQAKAQGFKNAWAMRKAAASKQRAAERALYGKIKLPATVTSSMDSCASQKTPGDCEQGNQARRVERLQQGNGPVRQLMRDGEWLVPETERPELKCLWRSEHAVGTHGYNRDGSKDLRHQLTPIESTAGNAEAPVPPHSQRSKPALSALKQQ